MATTPVSFFASAFIFGGSFGCSLFLFELQAGDGNVSAEFKMADSSKLILQ